MPNQPVFDVGPDVVDLTDGLAAGDYQAQHIGGSVVFFTNFPTDPTGEDVSWNRLPGVVSDVIQFTAGASDKVWVRTVPHVRNTPIPVACLAIFDVA